MKIRIRNLMIDITNQCNLNCAHCYNRTKAVYPSIMTLDQIDLAVSKAISLGLERIYLTGGEPLLHPDLYSILKHLTYKYKDVEIGITTNGLLLTKEVISRINECGNVVVQISVDGVTATTYEKTRGRDTFDSFAKGFEVLRSSNIIKKTARTCVSAFNYHEIDKIYTMCVESKIEPSFLFVTMLGNAVDNWSSLELSLAQKLSVVDKINALNKKYNYGISAPVPTYKCNFTQLLAREPSDFGEWGLSVCTDGAVSCCQFLYDYPIGNIFFESIEEMFTGKVFSNIVDLARNRRTYYVETACQRCMIKETCGFGCIGLSIGNGDANLFDGSCEYRRMYALFKGCDFIN